MQTAKLNILSILDPLFYTLLSPNIKRISKTLQIGGQDLYLEQYQHVFDLPQVYHVLQDLLSLASFGGHGFTRLAKSSAIKQTPFNDMKCRADAGIVMTVYWQKTCSVLCSKPWKRELP